MVGTAISFVGGGCEGNGRNKGEAGKEGMWGFGGNTFSGLPNTILRGIPDVTYPTQ